MSIVQEIMIRSRDYLRRIKEESQCLTGARIATVSVWKTTLGVSLGKKTATIGGVQSAEKNHDWKQPNRLLVVQTGDGIEQPKVFRAHAVPQGLCANLVSALKLLANQQEDGDGLLQNIVNCVRRAEKVSRTACVVDNGRALDVGSLSRGTGTFQVRKPKVPEGCPEVIVRESSALKKWWHRRLW